MKNPIQRTIVTVRAAMLTFVMLPLSITAAYGHPGGLDNLGGHNDRRSDSYHCHKDPCFKTHSSSHDALKEAISENRSFSLIYRREDWKHWSDEDGDCMNTRHEMLLESSKGAVKLSPDGCYVSKGVWIDPFSGITYTRASDLDVDHVVPLKWANDHGGSRWTPEKKERFANDPLNLLVVDDALNQQKGAKGPTEWLPPNHHFRCEYLARWKMVLEKYLDLTFFPTEKRTFDRLLRVCD